jgi:CRP-like cAMP-binding protein
MENTGDEFYVIHSGSVEIWSDPDAFLGQRADGKISENKQHVADLRPGQITGEIAMFDQGLRSADVVAGKEGATVLAFQRDRIRALCEDDAVLGTQLLWNISTALTQRMRFFLWQLHRSMQKVQQGDV